MSAVAGTEDNQSKLEEEVREPGEKYLQKQKQNIYCHHRILKLPKIKAYSANKKEN